MEHLIYERLRSEFLPGLRDELYDKLLRSKNVRELNGLYLFMEGTLRTRPFVINEGFLLDIERESEYTYLFGDLFIYLLLICFIHVFIHLYLFDYSRLLLLCL